jgi:hypothetical protein
MNEQEAAELVQRLYDGMFASLTGSSDGGAAASDPNRTFLTLHGDGRFQPGRSGP